jgi:hypothetical protein
MIGQLRIRADVEGVPARKVASMQMNEKQSAAQEKRERKLKKRKHP